MPKGLPASYIRKARRELGKGASFSRIFKRAWELYKGSKVYRALKGENPRKKSKSRKGGRRIMPKKSRRRRSFTIPLAAVSGAAAGIFIAPPGGTPPFKAAMQGNFNLALNDLIRNYTGLNVGHGTWNIMDAKGLHAAIIGYLVHKIASILGVNRALGRARVPILRI